MTVTSAVDQIIQNVINNAGLTCTVEAYKFCEGYRYGLDESTCIRFEYKTFNGCIHIGFHDQFHFNTFMFYAVEALLPSQKDQMITKLTTELTKMVERQKAYAEIISKIQDIKKLCKSHDINLDDMLETVGDETELSVS